MRLTILGSGAACPPGGGASSGYLVDDRGCRVLLDCGHGIASALLAEAEPPNLDAIIISHMHADHFIDLLPLRFYLSRDMNGLPEQQVALYLPPEGRETMHQILSAVCFPADFLDNVFQVHEYDSRTQIELGDGLRVRFAGGVHYIPGWALRLDGSSSLTYTGDTAPSLPVCALAGGSDALLAEATLDEPEAGPVRGHLTARQAAELASEARVGQLLLTHFWFDADRDAAAAAARQFFPGDVTAVHDGMKLSL